MIVPRNLISQAMELKPAERFIVIEALIRSLDVANPEIEEQWAEEVVLKVLSLTQTGTPFL